jgi:hypothetical protein
LRQRINDLIRGLNVGIKAGVEGSWYPERAHFIDVDSGVQDGQFCQPGHSIYDQYFGDKVLLWNLSPEGVITANSRSGTTDGSEDVYEVRQLTTGGDYEQWLNMIGPFQNHFLGMMLRPFHPREKGYSAMARQTYI